MQLTIEEYQNALHICLARIRTIHAKPVFQSGAVVPADKIRWALEPLKNLEAAEVAETSLLPPAPVKQAPATLRGCADTIAERRAAVRRAANETLPAIEIAADVQPAGDAEDIGLVSAKLAASDIFSNAIKQDGMRRAKARASDADIDKAVGGVGIAKE